jgi:WD40 repeat protein
MEAADPVTCVAISENGYTFAASHASAAVRAWDMRKQKVVSTMEGMLKSVDVVAFDKSGKYLAMGGEDGVKVTTVKQWGTTATYETKMAISGVVWSKAGLEACSDKERSIHFFQRPSN